MRIFWALSGSIALFLGVIGVFLPVMPTVPFLILAAYGFARSSERMHNWLLNHPVYGPPIADWQQRGAIGRKAKWIASVSMAAGFCVALALGLPVWVLAVQGTVLAGAGVFIWTRPDR